MSVHDEIARLLYVYAERVDAGDFDGVSDLFADATYRTEGAEAVLSGDEVGATMARTVKLYDGRPRTKHVVTNVIVEPDDGDPDTARARSSFTVIQDPPGQAPAIVVTGRYHDRFTRTAGAWHFADRLITIDQVGDLSSHLHLDRLGW